jgi:hypothetical protein
VTGKRIKVTQLVRLRKVTSQERGKSREKWFHWNEGRAVKSDFTGKREEP